MKNIFKFFIVVLSMSFLAIACRDEANNDWTSPKQSIKLYETSLGTLELHPSLDSDPLTFVWTDTVSKEKSYNVVFSSDENFTKKYTLGTSTTDTFSVSQSGLNSLLAGAGYNAYVTKKIFVRIENTTAGAISNVISFLVTPYPSTVPVITAPTAGESLVLDNTKPNDIAKTITWTDSNNYGVDVTYLVEVSKSGTNNFVTLGNAMNAKYYEATNKNLNDAALKAGLVVSSAQNLDIRVTAITKSAAGDVTKVSNIVTFKVTPYIAFKNLYFVGNATVAGWSTNNNNQVLFRDPSNSNKFYFTGNFNAGVFKMIEVLGQWAPMWGTNAPGTLTYRPTESDPDPGSINIATAGNYTFVMDISAKTYSLAPYTGSTTAYSTIGMIGDFNNWGGDLTLDQSAYDSHQWSLKDITITKGGKFKFRAEGGWTVNWGAATELSGQGTQGGADIPLAIGTYDIYFNDLDGRYQLIKK